MEFTYDYFNNLETPDFYLCNPDGRELFPLNAYEHVFTLRFNDLSSLEFKVPSKITDSNAVVRLTTYYDWIQTKRLIFVKNIGWFLIKKVDESDDGITKYKTIIAESYQSIFKDKSFSSEERIYSFYNVSNPFDTNYNASNTAAIPSVLGQLYQQLGIQQNLSQGDNDPSDSYDKWTVIYVSPELYYQSGSSSNICRSFIKNATYGYDWMVSDVEEAFGVIFIFDSLYKTIRIKLKSEIAKTSSVLLSFDNFMKNIEVSENAENIVTVLSCEGSGLDISLINPTGTKYIADFNYYMDESTHKWMSSELITKLKAWKIAVDNNKSSYKALVTQLRDYYADKLSLEETLTYISTILKDLKNARDSYIKASVQSTTASGIITAEIVSIGKTSRDILSQYNNNAFSASSSLTCYADPPANYVSGVWSFSGAGTTTMASTNYTNGNYYFIDNDTGSYCKLVGDINVNISDDTSSENCAGFKRYVNYAKTQKWITVYEKEVAATNKSITLKEASISATITSLRNISNTLNIFNYFSSTPDLLKELECYWIEGSYTNENFAILDNTTLAEEIDLANELLVSGENELSHVCQPHYSFTITPSSALMQYPFGNQINNLKLGDIIAVEKSDGVLYYPVLLEMQFSFDDPSQFSMVFANATRLDDWGYTYADLITSSSNTTRQVNANWQNIISYSKEKVSLIPLIKNPLDTALRAAFASAKNQEFVIDDTGILGRQYTSDEGDFSGKQLRLINNMLIFTDDGWETARAALGEISYTDNNGILQTSYGLIADAIIGTLIAGEKLYITNVGSSYIIDKDGIKINTGTQENPVYNTVETIIGTVEQNFVVANGVLDSKIDAEIYRAQDSETTLSSRITQTVTDITMEVTRASSAETELSGRITITADAISAEVSRASSVEGVLSSGLSQTASDIVAEVTRAQYAEDTLSGRITVTADAINVEVSRAQGIEGTISSSLTLLSNQISLVVNSSDNTIKAAEIVAAINNGESTIKLSANHVDLDGYVTITNLSNGITTIDGNCIKTGTISANRLDITGIINAGGIAITSNVPTKTSQLTNDSGFINSMSIPTKLSQLLNDSGYQTSGGVTTIIGNTITTGFVNALGISAAALLVENSSGYTIFSAGGNAVSIAGWKVDSNSLYSGADFNTATVWLCRGTSNAYTIAGHSGIGWVFKAGNNFGVDTSGALYCTSAHITGEINATSGTFSNCTIDNTCTINGTLITNNICNNTSVYNGYTSLGDISFVGSGSSICQYYMRIKNANDTSEKAFMAVTDVCGTMDASLQTVNRVNSYLITAGINISGTQVIISGSSCTVSAPTSINQSFTATGGATFNNNNATEFKHVSSYSSGTYGFITCRRSSNLIVANQYYDYGTNVYYIATPNNSLWLGGSGHDHYLNGSWFCAGSIINGSDRNMKHDIEDLSDKYSALFDNLKAVRYKYNEGTSDRYHTGFIAQKMDEAREASGLTRQEFAAVCIADPDTDKEHWGIRYEEIIALNTREIQRLKARVLELELKQ